MPMPTRRNTVRRPKTPACSCAAAAATVRTSSTAAGSGTCHTAPATRPCSGHAGSRVHTLVTLASRARPACSYSPYRGGQCGNWLSTSCVCNGAVARATHLNSYAHSAVLKYGYLSRKKNPPSPKVPPAPWNPPSPKVPPHAQIEAASSAAQIEAAASPECVFASRVFRKQPSDCGMRCSQRTAGRRQYCRRPARARGRSMLPCVQQLAPSLTSLAV